VTNQTSSVICDVVACNESATGRYLDVRLDRAMEFQLCAGHFARIEGGEVPEVVAGRLDLADLDDKLVLAMHPPDAGAAS
jgi:hypothetical protein